MKSAFFLGFVLVSVPTWAQNTVMIHVVDSRHHPVPGAVVELRPRREEVAPQSNATDRKGNATFSFPYPAGEAFSVAGAVVSPQFAFKSFAVNHSKMEVELEPASVWRGKVLDEAGDPIGGAKVEVNGAVLDPELHLRSNLLGTRFAAQFTSFTSADGSFEIEGVPSEGVEYRISAPKFAELQGIAGKTADSAQLHLVKGAVLRGRLLGVDGQGLPGIRVVALADMGFGISETAADGSFSLNTLLPGVYNVDFQVGPNVDFVVPGLRKVKVQKEEVLAPVELRAVSGVPVSGQVLSPDGEPVAGVSISVKGPLNPSISAGISASDGRFSVRCLPGANELWISQNLKGYRHLSFPNVITITDQPPAPLTFTLHKSVPLLGRIIDEAGKPLQAIIRTGYDRFISSDKNGNWSADSEEINPVAKMAEIVGGDSDDGYFEIVSPPTLDLSNRAPVTIIARKKKWTIVKGRTVDTDGKPLAGVRVSAQLLPYPFEQTIVEDFRLEHWAVSDANGNFTLAQMRHSNDSMLLKAKAFKAGYILKGGGGISQKHGKWGMDDLILTPIKP